MDNKVITCDTNVISEELVIMNIKFLKLCQQNVINGNIDFKYYKILSEVKINFIKNILNQPDFNIDNYIADLNQILENNDNINNMAKA
jgi:DNA topoisomerase VI subunit A